MASISLDVFRLGIEADCEIETETLQCQEV